MTTNQRHVVPYVTNSIPEGMLLPMHACHPVLTPASQAIMSPGTAFQMVMGSDNQKMCRGVFVSPTEWYVDNVTRPIVVSANNVDLDLRIYPGSHITITKTPAVWATMSVMRIPDVRAFETMVRKIDTRILHEIQRRIPVPPVETSSSILPTLPLQFQDVESKHSGTKYECKTCKRGFASSRGYDKHVCASTADSFTCGLCDRVYTTQARLSNHVAIGHNGRTTTKIQLHVQDQAPLSSQRPIPPSPFRFVESPSSLHEQQHAPLTQVQELQRTSAPTTLDVLAPHSHVAELHTSVEEEERTSPGMTADILPSHFRIVDCRTAICDNDLFDVESSHVMTPPEGLTSLEILAIAHGWVVGQEFIMTWKERGGSCPTASYESHGMLHRWDYSLESPGPLAFYPEEGKRNRYCEEPLECSTDNAILSLIPVAPTAAFDRMRRRMNNAQKRSRTAHEE